MAGKVCGIAPLIVLAMATACSSSEPTVPVEELVKPPDVVGENVAAASERLELVGFAVEVLANGAPPSPDVTETANVCPAGEVVNQDPPPDEEVRLATTVVLTARGC